MRSGADTLVKIIAKKLCGAQNRFPGITDRVDRDAHGRLPVAIPRRNAIEKIAATSGLIGNLARPNRVQEFWVPDDEEAGA